MAAQQPQHSQTSAATAVDSAIVTDSSNSSSTIDLEKAVAAVEDVPAPAAPGWDGPSDPRNPKNWTFPARVFHTAIPALFALATTFAVSVYTAATFAIKSEFHTSLSVSILGLSVFSLGLGIGPVLAAPLSESYGRRPVYMICAPLAMCFHAGAALAPNITGLLLCRFLAAFFGAPPLAIGGGSVADMWNLQTHGARVAGSFILMPFLGPIIGPIVGGYTFLHRPWSWNAGWVAIMFVAPIWLASLFMHETYAPVILNAPRPKLTAKRLGTTLVRPARMLVTEPIVFFVSLYAAFSMGLMFAFFASFPYVFIRFYGFDSGQVGLSFLGIFVGLLLAYATFLEVDRRTRTQTVPERRLITPMLASIGLPPSLFIFAWCARPTVHWIVPVLAGVPFGWANMGLFLGTATYLVEAYGPLNGASALAANGLLRYGFGAGFPLAVVPMFEAMGVGAAGSVWGAASVALMPVPWVLWKWGKGIRGRSELALKSG